MGLAAETFMAKGANRANLRAYRVAEWIAFRSWHDPTMQKTRAVFVTPRYEETAGEKMLATPTWPSIRAAISYYVRVVQPPPAA